MLLGITAVSPQKSESITEFVFAIGHPIIIKIHHWWSQIAAKWMVCHFIQQQTAVNYQLQQQSESEQGESDA